jgi:predicted phosphodiesterase
MSMRYGVLSDVHGNLHALHAVLDVLLREDIDAYLCLGDTVGYGPFPNECVAVVAGLGATTVAGNHDLIALGLLSDARCTPLARDSLRWTRGVLNEHARSYLAGLPIRAGAPGVVLAHGSPDDPQEYVRSATRADELLDQLSNPGAGCDLLLLGHTHEPWAHARHDGTLLRGAAGTVALRRGEAHLLNPGSVGQSRDQLPRARFLVLDIDKRLACFRAIRYDVSGCRAALRRAGLPDRSHHIRPPRFERLRRQLARAVE